MKLKKICKELTRYDTQWQLGRKKDWEPEPAWRLVSLLPRRLGVPMIKIEDENQAGSLLLDYISECFYPQKQLKKMLDIPTGLYLVNLDIYFKEFYFSQFGFFNKLIWKYEFYIIYDLNAILFSGVKKDDERWQEVYRHIMIYLRKCSETKFVRPDKRFLSLVLSILWYYGVIEVEE